MNLDQVLQTLKTEFPNKAIDLCESLELIKEVLNDTMNAINHKSNDAFVKRDFIARRQYDDIAVSLHNYEQQIDQFVATLSVDTVDLVNEDNDSDEETEKRKIPNYADYVVDNNVEHTLYENFTHKRPYAFRINENHIVEVKTWQEMLKKTAELLFTIDNDKFLAFEHTRGMNGKKNKYISVKLDGMRKPQLILDKVYIETNMSGNGIRNLILKMLKAYGYKATDYKVYFRADYTELNQE
ncbi:hypothetical protein [Paenibacillus ehimensis]|uniref:Phage protein n=1 Tax=Paenibacillus ehimensis TaxID=79264 RepID=A0ABT8VFR8_9BACL|nr:hypothetical protein [Paenibacillus ehimensis]MDO3679821.1 hypothetical protein [Paenibacillus ehimensis]HWO95137.1 hypothetical protein [Bacillus sp. (in: firmicutes)]